MTTNDDRKDDLELVMPFVTVASEGGPHDDVSYSAGWEMGRLDRELAIKPPFFQRPVRVDSVPQADLIAMQHGYTMRTTPHDDEWTFARFTKDAS